MATTLENGVRSIQIKFSNGSMTVSNVKESVTKDQVKTFAEAVGLFTTRAVTGFVITDKENVEVEG